MPTGRPRFQGKFQRRRQTKHVTFRQAYIALTMTVPRVTPSERANQIRAGSSVLIDVRQPKEWPAGVAEHARLLPLGDLCSSRREWKSFLQTAGDREFVLYCGAGVRSNIAARILRSEGFRAVNGGAYSEWVAAGWPTHPPN